MIFTPTPAEALDWRVVFFPVGAYRFAWLVPGRFKHCAAFAWVPESRRWIVYDVKLDGTHIYVLPEGPQGVGALERYLAGAAIVKPARGEPRPRPWRYFGFWCVPAVEHLLNTGCGALTPTRLYRALIAEGGEVITDGQQLGARTCRSCAA